MILDVVDKSFKRLISPGLMVGIAALWASVSPLMFFDSLIVGGLVIGALCYGVGSWKEGVDQLGEICENDKLTFVLCFVFTILYFFIYFSSISMVIDKYRLLF